MVPAIQIVQATQMVSAVQVPTVLMISIVSMVLPERNVIRRRLKPSGVMALPHVYANSGFIFLLSRKFPLALHCNSVKCNCVQCTLYNVKFTIQPDSWTVTVYLDLHRRKATSMAKNRLPLKEQSLCYRESLLQRDLVCTVSLAPDHQHRPPARFRQYPTTNTLEHQPHQERSTPYLALLTHICLAAFPGFIQAIWPFSIRTLVRAVFTAFQPLAKVEKKVLVNNITEPVLMGKF